MADVGSTNQLVSVVTLLGAAILVVPFFKKIGLGAVLGYLAAGLIIGPFGLQLFNDPQSIIHLAELGVVMFLFLIGLEMQPKHLWGLRKYIFGMGSLQILVAIVFLTSLGMLYGASWQVAFIAGSGFVLTSTAVVMQTLSDRGEMTSDRGKRIIAVLLFEDLLIVPLLAVVSFLAPESSQVLNTQAPFWQSIAIAIGALALLIVAGIWGFNPLFRISAQTKIRELMTAVALFVVLGSALLMEASGLSLAIGAFIAGVLLSNSSFRHQLEVDIDPFKGLLLGLFFLGVGMSLDLVYVFEHWLLIIGGVFAMMLMKGLVIYVVARLTGSNQEDSLDRAVVMAQGGEFAFVLFSTAALQNVISAEMQANMTAIVVLSMVLTPVFIILHQKFIAPRFHKQDKRPNDPIDEQNEIILIGLGRFGQVINRLLRSCGFNPTIIEYDVALIGQMKKLGIKSYFGDATHPDLLKRAGIDTAKLLIVALDNPNKITQIVKHVRSINPHIQIIARAYDRFHVIELTRAGSNIEVRETFDSALRAGKQALQALGIDRDKVHEIGNEFFGRNRHGVKLMAETYDPSLRQFENEKMLQVIIEEDQETMMVIQQILQRER
ncbi:monovalent cation:proton antiporter-2 (CPA2) family protein [Lonepinella koalarum]|uniref:Kef-type potassium/proton antiporter (CPA2 family) n=1 Tax=Lonepinella koalarum TaxID=53417 RepID=A0A4R1L0I0_9PAST|nr:monovalent cation:proton antiporter-2 (CPA2) family protein [Lonepinella koalarum]MDH2926257.1 potassium transporter [Lonepinella koalarum]TCK71408.1 Kef-type potassium/proton antiporter (CPA2 family) [Lonepinella koalarum]TFJ91119.1 potassium transporter [Lonepinella koalarum]